MSVNVYDPINDELIPVAGATLYGDAPVGSIIAFAGKEINLPEGYLAFNGQTVKRNDYPDLWAFAVANEQVGVDKFFSQGDGSTTFTLADLRETSLKGYGETSRTVGAHVKSGGLGVGEFIDDQLQDHEHTLLTGGAHNVNAPNMEETKSTSDNSARTGMVRNIYRTGATTEVKAVGVVWAVKAKQTGLPIDLKQQVENYVTPNIITVSGTTGTGDAIGTFHIQKSSYPNYKRIIPFGLTGDEAYKVNLANSTSTEFVYYVYNKTTGVWADGVNISFKAYAYKY